MPKSLKETDERRGAFEQNQLPTLGERLARHRNPFLVLWARYLETTGQRPGEETEKQMMLRDVDPALHGGKLNEVYTGDGKHGRRYFRACFPRRDGDHAAEQAKLIEEIRAIHPTPNDPNALLFPKADYGHQFRNVLVALDKENPHGHWLVDKEGGNLCPYSLRHIFITAAIRAKVHLEVIEKFCGTSIAEIETRMCLMRRNGTSPKPR